MVAEDTIIHMDIGVEDTIIHTDLVVTIIGTTVILIITKAGMDILINFEPHHQSRIVAMSFCEPRS